MLTFEKIRELERLEQESKDLAKLPETFLSDVADYLARKRATADEHEMKNIENALYRLLEQREKKLLALVYYAAKTGQTVEVASHERGLFEQLVSLLVSYRTTMMQSLARPGPAPSKTMEKTAREYYRVKRTLKPFVGPDLTVYQLKENDTIEKGALPNALNDLLVREGIIEKVVE